MIVGALILTLAVILLNQGPLAWVQSLFTGEMVALRPLQWIVPLVGGAGAIVSVMQRMASDSCILRYRVGATFLTMLGTFRPMIGAIFASFIVLTLASRFVPIQMDAAIAGDASHQIILFVVVAFLPGFSERLAQDMLGVATAQLVASKSGAGAVSA